MVEKKRKLKLKKNQPLSYPLITSLIEEMKGEEFIEKEAKFKN